ncbi:hypothetical protein HPB48_012062 [Haemaphysalis longicornis]|uniref:Uncharacterized protein n=1 Tax=Haemaphysalis longicornis TaxID=44386 RepID=A0A9J6H3L3_HAELO|nr:hypothetical protein HPB48_012062 [Haemaphysalis longicornis]
MTFALPSVRIQFLIPFAPQRDRSYHDHQTKCMAAVLPSVEASQREREACRIVVDATNMSRAAFWTVTQVQLNLDTKRAQCLREALPDTPEPEREAAFHKAAEEANALTRRHTDLRQKLGAGLPLPQRFLLTRKDCRGSTQHSYTVTYTMFSTDKFDGDRRKRHRDVRCPHVRAREVGRDAVMGGDDAKGYEGLVFGVEVGDGACHATASGCPFPEMNTW